MHKMNINQVFDGIIILASFTLDVIFVEGVVREAQGEETAALIIVFLLWRILRVINGINSIIGISWVSFFIHLLPPKKNPFFHRMLQSLGLLVFSSVNL